MRKDSIASLCFGCICLVAETAFGDVLFSTFGPNDSFDTTIAYGATWKSADPPIAFGAAARFQVGSGNYALSSVSVGMGLLQGTNNLSISIVADNGGKPTGTLLETVVSHPTDIIGDYQVVTYQSSLDPVLSGGSSYWLVVQPAEFNTADASSDSAYNWWGGFNHPVGPVGVRGYNFSTLSWDDWSVFPNDQLPAFRIEGFAVPEPSTYALALLGTAVLAFRLGRRRLT